MRPELKSGYGFWNSSTKLGSGRMFVEDAGNASGMFAVALVDRAETKISGSTEEITFVDVRGKRKAMRA
jgi:hypothetical protein